MGDGGARATSADEDVTAYTPYVAGSSSSNSPSAQRHVGRIKMDVQVRQNNSSATLTRTPTSRHRYSSTGPLNYLAANRAVAGSWAKSRKESRKIHAARQVTEYARAHSYSS